MSTEFRPSIERLPEIPPSEAAPERERSVPETPQAPERHPSASVPPQPSAAPVVAAPAPAPRDPEMLRIEHVLSEGLESTYQQMDPATQEEFRVKGEETAASIAVILRSVNVKIRSIIHLITDWLKIIPGVSRLFIEQEAKIKTDRLLEMRKKQPPTKQ